MYVPSAFEISDPAEIAAMLAGIRLGTLVTHGPQGLFASHLPFLHEPEGGRLIGHLARANPHRDRAGDGQALAIFLGVDAYVSPSWYASKAAHGRVVPTWNYEAIHVRGVLTWVDDHERLRSIVTRLTDRFEGGRPEPWSVSDAPEAYIEGRLGAIVGVELRIEGIAAKRKFSQNRPDGDRNGVADGLASSNDPRDTLMAAAMNRDLKT